MGFHFFELPASQAGVPVPGKHTHVVTQEEGHPGGFRGHRELAVETHNLPTLALHHVQI